MLGTLNASGLTRNDPQTFNIKPDDNTGTTDTCVGKKRKNTSNTFPSNLFLLSSRIIKNI